jgi:predicted ATPase
VEHLKDLAAKKPLFMVFEDVHWIDPTTSDLLNSLIEHVQNLPILLLVTFRPEFNPPWKGHAHVMSLTLTGLDRLQTAALVEQVTGGKWLPEPVLHEILAETDGVPLFVEELTKTVLEAGFSHDEGDRYTPAGPLPGLTIPATLHDSLLARFDRLAPVKEVAQIGAALGREFSHELLAAAAPLRDTELQNALDQLVKAELVFRRGTPPEATYSFKHALVRDAAYGTLLKGKRRQIHARIVAAIEGHFPETAELEPELLAHHCTQAGLTERAIGCWYKAGQRAMARSAMVEAVAQLKQALELVTSLPAGPDRDRQEFSLQVALGSALIAIKGFAASEVRKAYSRARELSREVVGTPEFFSVLYGQYAVHFEGAELEAAHDVAQELLRSAREQRNAAAEVTGHRIVGAVTSQLGRLLVARSHLEKGLALYDAARDRTSGLVYALDSRVVCLHYLSYALLTLGHPEQALARSDEALAHARELTRTNLAEALNCGCTLYQLLRDRQGTRQRADALIALATEHGFPLWLTAGRAARGWALVDDGQIEEGIEQIRRGLAEYRATGAQVFSPYFLALLADAYRRADQAAIGLGLVTDALNRVEQTAGRWLEAELHRLRGELLLTLREPDGLEAEACFGRALAVARGQGARMWELRAATSLARLWQSQGRCTETYDLLAPIHDWFTEGFDTQDLREAKALLDALT